MRKIDGISCVKTNGAFYLFPKLDLKELGKWKDDKELVVDLLKETGVCIVYGSGFGDYGKDHMRITFLPKVEIHDKVYNLIEGFLK